MSESLLPTGGMEIGRTPRGCNRIYPALSGVLCANLHKQQDPIGLELELYHKVLGKKWMVGVVGR